MAKLDWYLKVFVFYGSQNNISSLVLARWNSTTNLWVLTHCIMWCLDSRIPLYPNNSLQLLQKRQFSWNKKVSYFEVATEVFLEEFLVNRREALLTFWKVDSHHLHFWCDTLSTYSTVFWWSSHTRWLGFEFSFIHIRAAVQFWQCQDLESVFYIPS